MSQFTDYLQSLLHFSQGSIELLLIAALAYGLNWLLRHLFRGLEPIEIRMVQSTAQLILLVHIANLVMGQFPNAVVAS